MPVVAAAMAELATIAPAAGRDRVAAAMRRAKRIVALATAIADIGGIWPLERVTAALSDLAEATLSLAMAHLLRAAHDAGELRLPDPSDPARGGGFTVLGMGKLGARELNYSSDVDLVLLYDPAAAIYTEATEGHAIGGFTIRIARGLVSLMEARDADGYVFRTDLRLRPDPAVTPPAVALPAAITYYESMGQNWERAAMIKARPVAGDLALGAAFLEAIRPFVWRRGLDFAAVADIHAMKRRIDQHKGGALADGADPLARIAGHNVKLGEGGIREIEFLAQTLQLVWGGRDPALRVPTTLGALRLLVRAGHVPRHAARELAAAYRFLRRVEHRLQMIADRQMHELPQRPEELARFAIFMGYADASRFAADLLHHLRQVRARYAEVFELVPELLAPAEPGLELDFSGVGAAPERRPPRRCAPLASATPIASSPRCAAGRRGTCGRCVRRARANCWRSCCRAMLAALARQPQPDTVFNRFDAFLARQPAGVQLLSLFQRNPGLLDRIAAVLGAAPSLADHLASHPAALDGLLSPEENPDPARLLRARLRDARLLEDVIEITRRTVREEDFTVSVATHGGPDRRRRGRAAAHGDRRCGAERPAVAGAGGLRRRASAGCAAESMAVVALGKAGGREMMAGSDLDLMLIYDHPAEVTESRGARRLPVSQWFVRAAHAYVAAVTAPGVDGPLYEVDMRLRPSGNKGPVAVSLGSFRRYHAEAAWTWERMALTRARVVAGPPALRARIEAAIAEALAQAGDADSHPRRCRRDARAHAARPAAGRAVGREAARRRSDRGGVHRPGAATHPCARAHRSCVRPPRALRWRGWPRRACCRGRCGAADPRRPRLAHRAGHAAHHRRPRRARGAAGRVGARAAARRRRRRLTWTRCAPRWTTWRGRFAPRSSDR